MNLKLDYWEKQKTKHNIFYFYLDLFCVRHTFVQSCVKKKNVKGGGGGGGGGDLKSYTQKTEREKLSLPVEVATTLKFKVHEVD